MLQIPKIKIIYFRLLIILIQSLAGNLSNLLEYPIRLTDLKQYIFNIFYNKLNVFIINKRIFLIKKVFLFKFSNPFQLLKLKKID